MSRQSHEHPNWRNFFPAKPRNARSQPNIDIFLVIFLIFAAWTAVCLVSGYIWGMRG